MSTNIKRVRLIEVDDRKKKHDDYSKDEYGLNYRQRRFVSEYATSLNGTQAVIAAGYSKKTARVTASQLLTKPNIKAAVEKLQAKRLQRIEVTADAVLQKMAQLAFGDSEPSKPRPSDQIVALTQLGRQLGLFIERREVTGQMNILSMNVSASDLESAKQLVENFRSSEPPMIEGETIKDDDDASQ